LKIGIVGAGYVGLTTGICLASLEHEIFVYDLDEFKLEKIREKKLPFFEKGLEEVLEKVSLSKKLVPENNLDKLVEETDGCFICVGTPTKDNSIDLSQIINSVNSISDSIKRNDKQNYNIIIRSTIIPNTTRDVILPILQRKLSKLKFGLVVAPEFLREGNALDDFMHPDKIVIGSINEDTTLFVRNIFNYFKNKCEIIETNFESAELIKYTNNAFFSMLISFSNEIANVSEKILGVDPYMIMKALISDKRITTKIKDEEIIPSLQSYLIPGCGFGGSCFPKDVQALLDYAIKNDINTPLLKAVLDINAERPNKMIVLAESILGSLENKKISVLGLTFKPETDDLRSSPALDAIKILLQKKANIFAYDPILKLKLNVKILPEKCKICTNVEEALESSELVLIFTKWDEFKSLDSKILKKFMKNPIVIDGRGFLNHENFENGTYFKIGMKENL